MQVQRLSKWGAGLLIALSWFATSFQAQAQAKTAPVEAADSPRAADIARVESYLSGLTTIAADFSQINPDGGLAGGKFYLKRPGKMRWEYAPPTPVLLVSDGKTITYYDSELQQISYIGVDDTLAGFLTQKTITLESSSTHLVRFSATPGIIRTTLVQKSKPDEGSLTLEFSETPLALRQMEIIDATGKITRVKLEHAAFGGEIDEALFVFKAPRIPARRRQN